MTQVYIYVEYEDYKNLRNYVVDEHVEYRKRRIFVGSMECEYETNAFESYIIQMSIKLEDVMDFMKFLEKHNMFPYIIGCDANVVETNPDLLDKILDKNMHSDLYMMDNAICQGNCAYLEFLIQRFGIEKACYKIQDKWNSDGKPPLWSRNNLDIIKLIIKMAENNKEALDIALDRIDNNLKFVVKEDHIELFKIIGKHVRIDFDKYIRIAFAYNAAEIADYLLNKKLKKVGPEEGSEILNNLFISARECKPKMIDMLINNGCDYKWHIKKLYRRSKIVKNKELVEYLKQLMKE